MAKTIWKSVLKPQDIQVIGVPVGAEILCAKEQHNEICVWFLCDPSEPKVTRQIAIVGTGHPAPDDGRYLGTASLHGGSLMFHVFECT
jgi:hypothetical protein